MKWQSGNPKKELNLLAGQAPQSQANADRSDPVLRVNTILFSKTICSIRLAQAEGQGVGGPPPPPPFSPHPHVSSFAASLSPLIGGPQTLSFPWDVPTSSLGSLAGPQSGVQGCRLRGALCVGKQAAEICAVVSLHTSRTRRESFVPCAFSFLPHPFLSLV